MIRTFVLSVAAVFGLTGTVLGQPAPSATVAPAKQGPQSRTLVLFGFWSNCGNGIKKVRISVKYTPAAGGAAQTKDFDLDAPPAILDNTQWAFTTPANSFAVGDTVTDTFIAIYKGPPANTPATAAAAANNQNLVVQ